MIAYYVHDISPFLLRFSENFGLRWYGLAYVLAFVIGIYIYRWLARQGYSDLRVADVSDFILGAAIFGVLIGGRVGYIIFYDWQHFLSNPLSFFRVWEGGMSSHGGMVGLILYTLYYARKHHISWLNVGDNLVVVAPVGLFLGRMANFINGELYGRVTSVSWAMQFPQELRDYDFPPEKTRFLLERAQEINPAYTNIDVIITPGRPDVLNHLLSEILTPRHPSQFYEGFLEGVVLFAVMWTLRTRFRLPNGTLTGAFFIVYALLRIVGEFFREPDAPLTGWMTRGQFLSIFLMMVGAAFIFAAYRYRAYAPIYQKKNKFQK